MLTNSLAMSNDFSVSVETTDNRGFTPEEVWRYLEARCPIPSMAAELRDNGITPDMAAEHYGYDEDDFPMTLGEAYCAGEMDDVPQDLFDP